MGNEGGRDSLPESVEDVLASIGPRLRGQDGRLVSGASLLLVTYCRKNGITIDEAGLDLLAGFTGLERESMAEIVCWHDRAVSSPDDGSGSMILCLGTNCTLHGAEGIHPQLKAGLESQGMRRQYKEVFCLGQCEHGPSIMVDREIYCCRAQHVVSDNRNWREPTTDHIPIGDDSVPVRD